MDAQGVTQSQPVPRKTQTLPPNSESFHISDLSPFTTYNINVTAKSANTDYRPPARITVTTQMAAPRPMVKPDFYGVNNEEITVGTCKILIFTMLLLGCCIFGMFFFDIGSVISRAVLRLSNIIPGKNEARVVGRNTRRKEDNKKPLKTTFSSHRDIPYIVSGTTPFRALLLVHFSQCLYERIFFYFGESRAMKGVIFFSFRETRFLIPLPSVQL